MDLTKVAPGSILNVSSGASYVVNPNQTLSPQGEGNQGQAIPFSDFASANPAATPESTQAGNPLASIIPTTSSAVMTGNNPTSVVGAVAEQPAPTPPSMESILAESGLAAANSNVESLTSQAAQLQAAYDNYALSLNGQGVSQGIVNIETDANAKQMQIQLNNLNSMLSVAQTHATNIQSMVNLQMSAAGTDYDNAVKATDDAFSKAMQVQGLINTNATQQQTSAQSYLSAVSNLIGQNGIDWSKVPDSFKNNVNMMELQAGYPVGTLETFAKQKPGSAIISSTTGVDSTGHQIISMIVQNPDNTFSTMNVPLGTIPVTSFNAGAAPVSGTVASNSATGGGSAGNPVSGYTGSILDENNANPKNTPVDPQATIDDVLKSPAQTQALFSAMAQAEGGNKAAGAQYNNPLDLKYVAGNSYGATDSGVETTDGGTLAAFPDLGAAQSAYVAQLKDPLYQGLTVDEALKQWSGYTAPVPTIANGATPAQITSYLTTGPDFNAKGTKYSQGELYNAAVFDMLGIPNSILGGMGAAQGRAAMGKKENDIMDAYGLTPVQVGVAKSEYQGLSTANQKQIGMATAVKTFTATATDNMNLALAQSDQVARSGSKLVNNYAQWAQGNFTPAGPLAQFQTYIYTAAREYAKVTGGGAASTAALTDSASAAVDQLINSAQSPEAFKATIQAMQADMANVNGEYANTISGFAPNVANLLGMATGGSGSPDMSNNSSTDATTQLDALAKQFGGTQ